MPTRLIRPDGRAVLVEADKLQPALDAGYRHENVKEMFERQDDGVLAGAAGVLRGASAGLSDPAIVAIDAAVSKATDTVPQAAERLRAARESYPAVSLGGEVLGTVGGLVAGPVAGIAKLGNVARVKAGGGALGALAAGVTEGTLYGTGAVISENSLGDPTTNSQKLAAVGGGALFGAGLNVATHGLGKVASSAITKVFGGKTLQTALDDLANAALENQLGTGVKGLRNKRNIYGKNADEIFDYARKEGLVSGGDTNESFLGKMVKHREGVGEETGAILKDASSRTPGFDVQALYGRVRKELLPALEKDPSNSGSVKKIISYMDDLEALGPKAHDLESAWKLQSSLKKSIGYGEADGMAKQNMDKFRSLLRDEIKQQANAASPHYGSMLDDTSNRYRLSKSLEDLAEAQSKKQQSGGTFSVKDLLGGAMLAGNPGAAFGAVASKVARERGGFMVAAAADKLANSNILKRLANGLDATISTLDESGMLGAYRPVLQTAAARGAMNLLATHVQLAQNDPEYLPTLGMTTEEGEASNQYAGKAERLEQLAQKLQAHDQEVDYSVARFLKQKSGAYPSGTKSAPSMEDFEQRLQRITQLLQDPTVIDYSDLASTAPATAMAMSVQTQNAAGFLLSKAPKNPNAGLPAFHQPWTVSRGDLAKFYRYVDAAERPLDVLKELAKNASVPKEAVETMQVLYPQLLEDMKTKLMDRLLEYKKPLTYNQRRGLGSLFGDGFIGRNPQQLALIQQMHSNSVLAEQQAGSGSQKDGRQNQSQEDNLETQAQRIEAR